MSVPFSQTKVDFPDGSLLVSTAQAALLGGARSRVEAYAIMNEHPELYSCDFCARPGIVMSYDAADFDTGHKESDGAKHVSRGGWAACQTCADLIEADDREALADRSLESYGGLQSDAPEHREMVRQALRDVHDEFFRHRRGPGFPGVMPMPGSGLENLVRADGRLRVFEGRRRLARRERRTL